MTRPHVLALIAAVHQAARSPCRKSRRGVAAFNLEHRHDITGPSAQEGYVYSSGHNRLPLATCDGSTECRSACGRRWLLHKGGLITSAGEQLPAGWRRWDAEKFLAETEAQVLG